MHFPGVVQPEQAAAPVPSFDAMDLLSMPEKKVAEVVQCWHHRSSNWGLLEPTCRKIRLVGSTWHPLCRVPIPVALPGDFNTLPCANGPCGSHCA